MPEGVGGLSLIRTQRPLTLIKADCVRLTVDITGHVLGWPAELEQHLLQMPALGGVDHDAVLVDATAEQSFDLRAPQHLGEHRAVGADQDQPVRRMFLDP